MNNNISTPKAFSRMDRSFLGAWWWTVDRAMLGAIMALLVFGIIAVATTSPSVAQRIGYNDYHFITKHIIFFIPTILIILTVSMLNQRYIWRFASIMFIGSIIMMIAVLIFGVEQKGAKRWINFLGFSLQPSEFLKPAFTVVVAWFIALQKKKDQRDETILHKNTTKGGIKNIPPYYLTITIIYCGIITLLMMQPDLGMSAVITIIIASQIILAGLRFRYIAGLFAIGLAGLIMAYFSLHHVRSRVDRFFNPSSGDNYQVDRSLAAIKKGGITGTGLGQGIEKNTIPDAHADFTFSVLTEEGGFILASIIIGLFIFILHRGFKRLQENYDDFSVLAAGGLLTMVGFQSLVHIGSNINIIPTKGMTLPFISYGGSSMLSMGIAMGMILALTRYKKRSYIARSSLKIRKSSDKSN